jgi:hypothetical protein
MFQTLDEKRVEVGVPVKTAKECLQLPVTSSDDFTAWGSNLFIQISSGLICKETVLNSVIIY